MTKEASERLGRLQACGNDPEDAWNLNSVVLTKVAEVIIIFRGQVLYNIMFRLQDSHIIDQVMQMYVMLSSLQKSIKYSDSLSQNCCSLD